MLGNSDAVANATARVRHRPQAEAGRMPEIGATSAVARSIGEGHRGVPADPANLRAVRCQSTRRPRQKTCERRGEQCPDRPKRAKNQNISHQRAQSNEAPASAPSSSSPFIA